MRNRVIILAVSLLLLSFAAVAFCDDDPYGKESWEGADSAPRDGLNPEEIEIEGLEWSDRKFRASDGSTRYVVKDENGNMLVVSITVFDNSALAHDGLENFLMSCSGRLDRGENASLDYGDVTFAARAGEPPGNVSVIAFTRVNVLVVVQRAKKGLSTEDVKKLAEKIVDAIDARPEKDSTADLSRPTLAKVNVAPDESEERIPVLVVEAADPGGLAMILRYDAPGLKAERKGDRLYFYAEKPGSYKVKVTAVNTINLKTGKTFEVNL